MISSRRQIAATIVVGFALAATGSLTSAFDVDAGLDLVAWAIASCTAVIVMSCVLATAPTSSGDASNGWPRVATVLAIAAWIPYAAESVCHRELADVSLAATAIAVALWLRRGNLWLTMLAAAATGLACACQITAAIWLIAGVLSALSSRDNRARAGIVLAAGAAGVVVGRLVGWPMLSGYDVHGPASAMHRDLAILMPAVLLGLVGYSKGLANSGRVTARTSWLLDWTGVATACLLLAVWGVPLDVRLCVLPLFWWMPVALAELARLLGAGAQPDLTLRAVGLLSCAVLASLAVTGVLRLADGPLLAVHILSP